MVAEIAASAQEQATGLAEVNTAVNQMDQVTQQNAAMVEQSTAASHALAKEAEELARLIGAASRSASMAGKPSRRPDADPPAGPVPAAAGSAQLKPWLHAALASQSEAAPADEGWEEF